MLDVNSLAIPAFENLYIFVVDKRRLKEVALVVVLAISLLLHGERGQMFAANRHLDLLVPIHSSDLALQKVRGRRHNFVNLNGCDCGVAVCLLVFKSDDISRLDELLLSLFIDVRHE